MKKKRLHTQKRLALRRAVSLAAVLALSVPLFPFPFRNESLLRYEEQRQGIHRTELVISYQDPGGRPGTKLLLSQSEDCVLFVCAFRRFLGWEPFFSVPIAREEEQPLQWSAAGWGTSGPDGKQTESYQYLFGRLSRPEVEILRFQNPETAEVVAETRTFYTVGQDRYFLFPQPLSQSGKMLFATELLAIGIDAGGSVVCQAESSRWRR